MEQDAATWARWRARHPYQPRADDPSPEERSPLEPDWDNVAPFLEVIGGFGGRLRWRRDYVPGALPSWLVEFGCDERLHEAFQRVHARLEFVPGAKGEEQLRVDWDRDDGDVATLPLALVMLGVLAPLVVGSGQDPAIEYDAEHAWIVLRGVPREGNPPVGA